MRASYVPQLRGKKVALGEANRLGDPGFHSVLSEGDKRTLALAFSARLYVTPDAPVGKSVVLDDPACGFR